MIQQYSWLTCQPANNLIFYISIICLMTHKKLSGFNNFNKSPSSSETVLDSLQDNKSASKTKRSSLRKATFRINSNVLDSLDRYHLQLQLNLGKCNTPFKETIVELALQKLLEEADFNPEQLLESLQQQQKLRS